MELSKSTLELQRRYERLVRAYKNIKLEVALLNGEQARRLLETRRKNRTVSARTVAAYMEEMIYGDWKLTNQALGIDEDGHLYDGQHRCWAIYLASETLKERDVNSDLMVPVTIMRGLPKDAIEAVDVLRARTIYENRQLFHNEATHGRKITTYTSLVASLLAGGDHIVFRTVTAQERWRELAKEGVDWAIKTFDGERVLRLDRPGIAGALAFAFKRDPEAIDRLGVGLRTGVGLKAGSPGIVLRNWLSAQMKRSPSYGGSYGRMNLVRVVLNAARAEVEGLKLAASPRPTSEGIAYFRQAYNGTRVRSLVNFYKDTLKASNKGFLELKKDPNVIDREALRPPRERVKEKTMLRAVGI